MLLYSADCLSVHLFSTAVSIHLGCVYIWDHDSTCASQCAEVMAGTGLLPEDLAPPMATHLPVASPISVAVSAIRARHQAGQEALGPTGQALPAARPRVTVSPARTHGVAPCGPNRRLQQLVGAVIEGG